jgi:hypothetical protein
VKTLVARIAALDVIRGGNAPGGEPAPVAHIDFEIGPNAARELLIDQTGLNAPRGSAGRCR